MVMKLITAKTNRTEPKSNNRPIVSDDKDDCDIRLLVNGVSIPPTFDLVDIVLPYQHQHHLGCVQNTKLKPIVQGKLCGSQTIVARKKEEKCARNKVPYHSNQNEQQRKHHHYHQHYQPEQHRCSKSNTTAKNLKVLLSVVFWLSFATIILLLLFFDYCYYYHYYYLLFFRQNSIVGILNGDRGCVDLESNVNINKRDGSGYKTSRRPMIDQRKILEYFPFFPSIIFLIIISVAIIARIFLKGSSTPPFRSTSIKAFDKTITKRLRDKKFHITRKVNINLFFCLTVVYLLSSPTIAQIQHAFNNHIDKFGFQNDKNDDQNPQHDDFGQPQDQPEDDDDQTAYPSIRALLGKDVGLPCNISQSGNEGNAIKLILWYKNSILGSPIYSVDARDTNNLTMAKHFLSNSYMDRAWFEMDLPKRMALLFVKNLQHDDDGHYICRVDYRWTRTTISNVRLEVIVPPFMIRLEQIYRWMIPPPLMMMVAVNNARNGSKVGMATIANINKNSRISFKSKDALEDLKEMEKSFKQEFHYLLSNNQTKTTTSNNINDNNGTTTMINDITIVRQPEESTLTLNCDSFGGKPMSMVKWFRLGQFEKANLSDVQLLTLLQSYEEKNLQLIDDGYFPLMSNTGNGNEQQQDIPKTMVNNFITLELIKKYHNGSNKIPIVPIVRNELDIGRISIENHGQLYLCRIINTNLTKSINLVVKLEVYAAPKRVNIQQRLPTTQTDNHQWPTQSDDYYDDDEKRNGGNAGDNNVGLNLKNENRTWNSIKLLDHYLHHQHQHQHHHHHYHYQQPVQNPHNEGDRHAMKSFRLRSGYEFDFVCLANGSLPAAKIFWYLKEFHTNTLRDITDLSTSHHNGYDTLSYLRMVPQFTDNKANLICQAYNPVLHELSIQHYHQQKQNGSTSSTLAYNDPGISTPESWWHQATSGNDQNDIRNHYLNSITENIMVPEGHHQAMMAVSATLMPNGQHSPFQLLTSVHLDVNYKPIVSIHVLSGEQMYEEVRIRQRSNIRNQFGYKKDESVLNNSTTTETMTTTTTRTATTKTKTTTATIRPKNNMLRQHDPLFEDTQSHEHYYRFIEMEEIFFNCSINSNPEAHSTQWYCNEKLISIDIPKGIIITNKNRTLIISPSTRRSSGMYHCSATNILGQVASDRVQIDILFKPQCQVEFVQTYYQHLGDYVQLKCHIWANPSDDVKFSWSFNDSTFIDDDVHFENNFLFDHLNYESDSDEHEDDKWRRMRPPAQKTSSSSSSSMLHSTTTHSAIDHRHLITNVIRIQLKKWSSFGHFNCKARNSVGLQAEPCRWHIIPHHYHAHYRNNLDPNFMYMLPNQQQHHHHQYNENNRNSQSNMVDQRHLKQKATLPNQLNNCHIIESSNAVVIKCSNRVEVYERTIDEGAIKQGDHYDDEEPSSIGHLDHNNTNRIPNELPLSANHEDRRPYLTYHVQVFRIDHNAMVNNGPDDDDDGGLSSGKINKDALNQQHQQPQEQQYSHQKSFDQPESKKQISGMQQPSQPLNPTNEPVMVMDTLNFTNPLFIITNLSASTSYLLRIWSSKMYLDDTMIEQVNITVRTKSDDDFGKDHHGQESSSQSSSFMNWAKIFSGKHKSDTLIGMIMFISFCFVLLTLTFAIVKIRFVTKLSKARHDVNVNEPTAHTINVFETSGTLCEMRPDTLEKDLNYKNNNRDDNNCGCANQYQVLDTFKPYVNVENIPDSFMMDRDPSPKLIIKCDLPAESGIITYQNYLFPVATTNNDSESCGGGGGGGSRTNTIQKNVPTPKKMFRVNCTDEDATIEHQRTTTINNQLSNPSFTTTSDSGNTNSQYSFEPLASLTPPPPPPPPPPSIRRNELEMADPNYHHHHHHSKTSSLSKAAGIGTSMDGTGATTLFCMNAAQCSDESRQFLLPNSFQYPLSLRIVPEINEHHITSTTMQTSAAATVVNGENSNLFCRSEMVKKEIIATSMSDETAATTADSITTSITTAIASPPELTYSISADDDETSPDNIQTLV